MKTKLSSILLAAAVALPTFASVGTANASDDEAARLVSMINAERARAGLKPVERHWDLEDDAKSHTRSMAAAGQIAHHPNLNGIAQGYAALAEFEGSAASLRSVYETALASPAHRQQMLGGYDKIGVAVNKDSAGNTYATWFFMQSK